HARAQGISTTRYCAKDGGLTLILIDITTPYDQTDKNIIVRMTNQVLAKIQGGDRLMVKTISDSHTHSEKLVEHCIPYCPESGQLGKLFKCSDGAIKTDLEGVREDVIRSLKSRLLHFDELKHSDIVRTIFASAKEENIENRKSSLYIYSDLIENSDYLPSRYLFSYTTSRLMNELRRYRLVANLKGATVNVFGVGRADTRDRRPLSVNELTKLNEFWETYFKETGASSVRILQDVP